MSLRARIPKKKNDINQKILRNRLRAPAISRTPGTEDSANSFLKSITLSNAHLVLKTVNIALIILFVDKQIEFYFSNGSKLCESILF